MSSQLGSVEVTCDAPPYEVVRACQQVGFRTPLDVRWVRSSGLVSCPGPRQGWFAFRRWLELLGLSRPASRTCSCGERLPPLRWHRFIYHFGGQSDYVLGQCPRCHTIFWDQA
jgi:hypothetical protein